MTADDGRQRRRKLSDDERTLWRRVTQAIPPLKRARAKAEDVKPEAAPPAKKSKPDEKSPAAPARSAPRRIPATAKAPPELAPLDRKQRKKLARGSEPIDARLDLHGCTQSEAHAALLQFLRRAQHNGARYVLVITGKGRMSASDGSREAGVLKRQVPLWLRLPEFRVYVTGFESAHVGHGGEGALYVRLRRGQHR
jgi:DNA-nicking Smr family endonuclease